MCGIQRTNSVDKIRYKFPHFCIYFSLGTTFLFQLDMVRINAGCTGEFFLTQGRPQFNLSGCVILCITRYRLHASSEEFQDEMLVGSSPNWHSLRHAEEYAIGGIEKIETYLNW